MGVLRAFEEMVERGGLSAGLSMGNTVFLHDWRKVMASPLTKEELDTGSCAT